MTTGEGDATVAPIMRRRDVLAALPAGLAAVSATLAAPLSAAGQEPLRVMAWEGYDDPAFFQGFVARRGTRPVFDPMDDSAAALARLRAGLAVDLSEPCLYELDAWIEGGVVQPFATAELRNWQSLWPSLQALAAGPEPGTSWFAPFDWGPASVIYRTDLLDPAPTSWGVLFDDALAGRIAMQRSPEAVVGAAALALGIREPWDMDEAAVAEVAALVARQREIVATWWEQPVEAEVGLETGTLVAAYGWNDIYARLAARGVPVAFMRPREGYLVWVCGLARMAAARSDPGVIADFIDAMLSPEAGAALIARFGYGHANREAFDLVPPAMLRLLALEDTAPMLAHATFLDRMDLDRRRALHELFAAVLEVP